MEFCSHCLVSVNSMATKPNFKNYIKIFKFCFLGNANSIDQNHLLYEGNPNFQISPLFLVALGMESFPLNGHPGNIHKT